MTLEFFYKNYDLLNSQILSIEENNNELTISLMLEVSLELIANGYRPDYLMQTPYSFSFKIDKKYSIEAPFKITEYKLNDEYISLVINNIQVKLLNIHNIKLLKD